MTKTAQGKRRITVRAAVSLGVGSIVGAGIFTLMGVAGAKAGSAVWFSFLAAGIIALLTGHSFAQLGIRYPSRGGAVEYLVQAYGSGRFSGACSILFYITCLIGMAMIALTFGKFSARLIGIVEDLDLWERILASGLIVGISLLKLIGSSSANIVGRVIVIANLLLVAGFAVALSPHIQSERLVVETWPAASSIFGSLALTFFAFTGFEVISNTADRMENPARDLPRAMYTTIIIVIVLYVGLALAVVGVVSEELLASSGPTLIAVAARSIFGELGFTVLLVSAVISSVTCINGGLYGITSTTYTLAERGQLPPRFMRKIGASTRGMTISAVLALILINSFSLETVASLGSATSLLVYALVNFGALRLVEQRGWHRILIFTSVLACSFAVLVWILYTLKTAPASLAVFFSFLIIAFVAESLLGHYRGRILTQKDLDDKLV
ncbi:MAG: APC family permease [Xanthomonadales bacterium]|nr:APC family permease [Xanthomonadales bacterium]